MEILTSLPPSRMKLVVSRSPSGLSGLAGTVVEMSARLPYSMASRRRPQAGGFADVVAADFEGSGCGLLCE
jgi:hypothetical protein